MAREGVAVQVYLTEGLRGALLGLTAETGRSMSDEIRRAIERHLASRPRVVEPPLPADVADRATKPKRGRKPKGSS